MNLTRELPLESVPNLNDTHIRIIKILEKSEAENYEGVSGKSISELADDLDLKINTVSERVSELNEMELIDKNKSEFSEKSVVIRPSNYYDINLGNRKIYMKENGINY